MKVIPSQSERTIFLWLILVFMAMLIPQCWWTIRWSGHGMICTAWMLLYVSILSLASCIMGTKRQIVLWLSMMLSLMAVHWFSDVSKPYGETEYWHHLGADITGLVNPNDAILRLAAGCLAVFALSFVVSWLLDRFVAPLNGTVKKQPDPNDASEPEEKQGKTSSRIRLLIAAAATLFLMQAVSNVVKVNFGAMSLGQSFLIPAMASTIVVLACGTICRLRLLPAFAVGLLAATALTGGGVAMAVQGGSTANPILAICVFGFFVTILALIFGLLGNSRQPFQLKIGWLFVATAVLACAIPAMNSKYDLFTLLLKSPHFDFKEAAYQKALNSHPDVEVTHTRFSAGGRWRAQDSFDIQFKSDGTEDFFNSFDALQKAKATSDVLISGMGPRVDLNELSKLNPVHLHFVESELSSQQLADIAQLDVPVTFASCKFTASEVRQPNPSFTSEITFWSKSSPTLDQFVKATEEFSLDANFLLRNEKAFEEINTTAVLDLVEKSSSGTSVSLYTFGASFEPSIFRNR